MTWKSEKSENFQNIYGLDQNSIFLTKNVIRVREWCEKQHIIEKPKKGHFLTFFDVLENDDF